MDKQRDGGVAHKVGKPLYVNSHQDAFIKKEAVTINEMAWLVEVHQLLSLFISVLAELEYKGTGFNDKDKEYACTSISQSRSGYCQSNEAQLFVPK